MTHRLRRLSSEAELAALRPVFLEFFGIIADQLRRHHGVDLDPEGPVDAMFARPEHVLPPIGHTLVAEDDCGILGTVVVKPLGGHRVEIKRLYVRSQAQGLGLGKALLGEAKSVARDMGANEMYLDTLGSLKAALALYRADGFREVTPYPGSEIAENARLLPHAIFMKRAL